MRRIKEASFKILDLGQKNEKLKALIRLIRIQGHLLRECLTLNAQYENCRICRDWHDWMHHEGDPEKIKYTT